MPTGLERGRQRSFGSYCNEEQAHFGPPGTTEAFYHDFGSQSGSGGQGWFRVGPGTAMQPEFEEEAFAVTSFSDEDAEELDVR